MSAKLTFLLTDSGGAPNPGLFVQVKIAGTSTVVASTGWGNLTDNGDGSYTTAAPLASGSYDVYVGAGAGTIWPSLTAVQHIDAALIPSALPVPVNQGGTGAITASAARTALGLGIGVNVQAYNAYLVEWEGLLINAHGAAYNTFPYYLVGYGWQYPSAANFRTAIGCGTAATAAYTKTGEAGKVAMHDTDDTYYPPIRTSHLTANAANWGKLYRCTAGGMEGLYYVGKTQLSPAVYAIITVEEHAITGA